MFMGRTTVLLLMMIAMVVVVMTVLQFATDSATVAVTPVRTVTRQLFAVHNIIVPLILYGFQGHYHFVGITMPL